MGIFNEPKRLAKILASVKVNYEERPLKPIEVAKELQTACKELGDDESAVQKRLGLSASMWSAFKRLLTISEDIQNEIKWGSSDPESLRLGFSVAHVISKFSKEDQNKLVAASWEYDRPLRHVDLKHIHSFMLNNPDKTIEECISEIFQVNHPKRDIIRLFISSLDSQIFENLKKESVKEKIPLKAFSKNILSKNFSLDSILSVMPHQTFIQIAFTENGKKEFEKLLLDSKTPKNDFLSHLFKQEGF